MSRACAVVAGIGVISPLGSTWATTAERLRRGDTGVREVTHFDVEGFPSRVAAWIDERFDDTEDRRLALARRAAAEATAGVDLTAYAPERIGVYIGAESGRATVDTIRALARAAGGGKALDHAAFGAGARALARRIDASMVSPAAVASALSGELGARGPSQTVSLACASSNVAIAEAVRALRLGTVDVAVCGGVGADVDPFMLIGFGKLGALSEKGVSCPFDVRRDGFVVGEGAAMFVLTTELDHGDVAITGMGRTLDAHHLTAPHPEGDGAARAMAAALADAGRDSVGYVQAHGTSTPLNDAIEAAAITRVLGESAADAYVSSVKGAVGHWVAGAGAIGLACAIEALRGHVLPTAGLTAPDRDCALRHVIGESIAADIDVAMVNSFAFGGANSSLVVERLGA
jgi:3-oxoacyl-[acyl-carrier-protein] synthase II